MAEYSLPYGSGYRTFELPDDWDVEVLRPKEIPGAADEDAASALADESLKALDGRWPAGPDRVTAAVAINDKTRPVPHAVLLPALLRALEGWGYLREDIVFIIAVGGHAPMLPDEFPAVIPEGAVEGCRVISHDPDDADGLTDLGTTSAGTPCRVNRTFAEADLRIVVGNIEPHQFMGWSGGAKSAAIGLGARETIAANHSMMTADGAGPCRYADNPVRMDVEDMGRLIGVDMALNVVMNGRKEIVSVLAGDPADVMERGIAVGTELFAVPAAGPADIVICSPGGRPKDINLYQAQKALRHSARAARPGAPIIVAAECTEGIGSEQYRNWMADKASHDEVKAAFASEPFRLGHHKGMLVSDDADGRDVYLVSDIPDSEVRGMLLDPAESIPSAVERITAKWRNAGRTGPVRAVIVPYGNSTVPLAV